MPALTRGRSTQLRLSAGSPLLNLPEGVLRVVFGWSPNAAAAQALSSCCRAMRGLGRNPAAVALLMLHCPWGDPDSALRSSSAACEGGSDAVVLQVVQLLQASPNCRGPYSAPPPLLQAMLYQAACDGIASTVHALLHLPTPPDVNGDDGQVLLQAVYTGPHLAVMQALLERGADPALGGGIMFYKAGGTLRHFPALPLLLQHCLPAGLAEAVRLALLNAVVREKMAIVESLLPVMDAAGVDSFESASIAAPCGLPRVLKRLLDHRCSAGVLKGLLCSAALRAQTACVAVLLDKGAALEPPATPSPLHVAVYAATQANVPPRFGHATVGLLLRRGAQVSPAMLALAAGEAGSVALLGLLQWEMLAPAPADPHL